MLVIEPILAVFFEPSVSLAISHFSATKKSKSFTTDVMDLRFPTVVTSLAPTLFSGFSYSSNNSLTW
jgi:hypothetical protein